jgi:hypothetical protein
MSDFLSDLLDRAWGRAPVLQRRRPSRFEAHDGRDGQLSAPVNRISEDPVAAVEAVPDVADAPGPLQRTDPVAPRQRSRPAVSEVNERPEEPTAALHRLAPDPPSQVPAPEPRQVPGAAPAEPPAARRVEAIERRVSRPRARAELAPETSRSDEPSAIDRATSTPAGQSPGARPGSAGPLAVSADRDGQRDVQQGRPQDNSPGPPPVRPETPSGARWSEPTLRPATPLAHPSHAPVARHAPPEPTIQVTIGRIEVRAVSAPSSPTARAGRVAAPKLNLEDYLKSRGGGSK